MGWAVVVLAVVLGIPWIAGFFLTALVVNTTGIESFGLSRAHRAVLLIGCFGVLASGAAVAVLAARAARGRAGYRPVLIAAAATVAFLAVWVAAAARVRAV